MKYNKETKEQEHALKDGRTIFKTHNGFKCWLVEAPGKEPIEVTPEYYTRTLKRCS